MLALIALTHDESFLNQWHLFQLISDELFCCCVPMYIYIIKSMYNNTTFIHMKMYS